MEKIFVPVPSAVLEASSIGWRIRRRAFMNQLLTCNKVKFVWAAIVRFSSSVGYGCWNVSGKYTNEMEYLLGLYALFAMGKEINSRGCILDEAVDLTTRCWNSHDRIIDVACLGRTPRFCFLPRPRKSSSSSPEPGDVGDGDRLAKIYNDRLNWPTLEVPENIM